MPVVWGRYSSTLGMNGYPCLVFDHGFTIKYGVNRRLLTDDLYQIEKFPFVLCLLRVVLTWVLFAFIEIIMNTFLFFCH